MVHISYWRMLEGVCTGNAIKLYTYLTMFTLKLSNILPHYFKTHLVTHDLHKPISMVQMTLNIALWQLHIVILSSDAMLY